MNSVLYNLILEKGIKPSNSISYEKLYEIGMDNVKKNIDWYSDKPYTCESVIRMLFITGVEDYILSSSKI